VHETDVPDTENVEMTTDRTFNHVTGEASTDARCHRHESAACLGVVEERALSRSAHRPEQQQQQEQEQQQQQLQGQQQQQQQQQQHSSASNAISFRSLRMQRRKI
jgi:transcription initiation factor TFIID subunit TAF12